MTISGLSAQFRHENVFPGLSGTALLQQVTDSFRTQTVLDYSVARDTLFARVDGRADSLECIYTGMKLHMPSGQDPTEAVYLGGIPNGINTEHVYPQSKGAMGLAQSDMYNLYPSRIKTNSDRGDFPMGDIPDATTKTWYRGTEERSTPPVTGRDIWSEIVAGKFEPREAVKGNIARSIFYFYTMYRSQADAADPAYFGAMMSDLCRWHYDDPVDSLEWERNHRIAVYQGGHRNPFILDCSLVSRAYCNNIDQACEAIVLSSTTDLDNEKPGMMIHPSPGDGHFYVTLSQSGSGRVNLMVKDVSGREVATFMTHKPEGAVTIEFDISHSAAGLYVVEAYMENNTRVARALYIHL